MRKEAIPSLVVCLVIAAALSVTLFDDFDRSPLVAIVKVVGILGLAALGVSLAFSKKKADL